MEEEEEAGDDSLDVSLETASSLAARARLVGDEKGASTFCHF